MSLNGTRPCTSLSAGHVEEVSTLAAQHDGQVLASASPAFGSTPCEIRIWKTDTGKCSKVQIGIYYSNSIPLIIGTLTLEFSCVYDTPVL